MEREFSIIWNLCRFLLFLFVLVLFFLFSLLIFRWRI